MFCTYFKQNAYTITVDGGYTYLTYMHLMYTYLMYTTSTNVSNKIGIPLPPNPPSPSDTPYNVAFDVHNILLQKRAYVHTIILQLDIFCLFRAKYTITVGGGIRI